MNKNTNKLNISQKWLSFLLSENEKNDSTYTVMACHLNDSAEGLRLYESFVGCRPDPDESANLLYYVECTDTISDTLLLTAIVNANSSNESFDSLADDIAECVKKAFDLYSKENAGKSGVINYIIPK